MKTAIIIMAILAVVFWIASRIFAAAVQADTVEAYKALCGRSVPAFLGGLCRLLTWLCEGAFVVLMIILIL